MPREELLSRLQEPQAYTLERGAKTYQVEVELLENTEDYLHVMVAVDDGNLPASLFPATQTFICRKYSA
jgi:hypothetical protein